MKIPFALRLVVVLVLACASPAAQAADQQVKQPENVLKILAADPDLSKFAGLVNAADLTAELSGKDALVTMYAPTNAAVDKIPAEVMKKAKADKDSLRKFVLYHTVMGSDMTSGSIRGRKAGLGSGAGEILSFDGTGKDLKVNDAVISKADITSTHGTVHVIQAALIPPSFQEKPKFEAVPVLPLKLPELKAPVPQEKTLLDKIKEKVTGTEETQAKPLEETATPSTPSAVAPTVTAPATATPPTVATPTAPKAPTVPAPVQKKEEKKRGWKIFGF